MDNLTLFFQSFTLNEWIVDIVMVLILLLFAALGAHKGMVLTLCSLVSVVLGFLGGRYLADLLTPALVKQAAPMLEGLVEKYLAAVAAGADAATQEAGFLGLVLQELLKDGFASVEPVAAELAVSLAESVIYPLVFLLAFILILVVCWFIAHALDLVARLPVLHTLNSLGGFVLGLIKGCLLVAVLIPLLLRFLGSYIPTDVLEHSRILAFIDQFPRFL